MSIETKTPVLPLFGRLLWMLLGPLAVALCAFGLVQGGLTFGWLDLLYAVAVGLLPLGRWLEFRGGHAKTSTGEPATVADLRRYSVLVPTVGLLVWAAAKGAGWMLG